MRIHDFTVNNIYQGGVKRKLGAVRGRFLSCTVRRKSTDFKLIKWNVGGLLFF